MFINLRKMNSTSGSCSVLYGEVIRQLKDEMRKKEKNKVATRRKRKEKIIICRVGEIAGFILLTITGKWVVG